LRRIPSVFAVTVLLVCRDQQKTVAARTTDSVSLGPAMAALISVDRPTVVGVFAASQAFVDSNDVAEVLADYEHYVDGVVKELETHGVHVKLSSDSTIRWRDSLGVHTLVVPDTNRILYLFLLPSGHDTTLREGVAQSDQLLSVARDFFHLPIRSY